ncbi:MAG: TIGR02147 family protein [Pseudobdellovibrionaceae bacterium]
MVRIHLTVMTTETSIFDFKDACEFLNYEFGIKQLKNSRFSLRAWSRQLGYENPSFVSQVLKGKRRLKIELAKKFAGSLKLTGPAKKYFEVLVLLKNSKEMDEKKIYLEILESLRPENTYPSRSLNIEDFRLIADWHHIAFMEMLGLKDFQNHPEWVFERLGRSVSIPDIKKAIQRLHKLKLIQISSDGKITRTKQAALILENNLPSEAVRYFHKQMLEKVVTVIETQLPSERDLRGTTLSFEMKDYERVQAIIKKAHQDINNLSANGQGEEIMHFSTQFFKLTKKRKEDL